MCIVKCIFSDQIIFMVHIPFNGTAINQDFNQYEGNGYKNGHYNGQDYM